MSLTPQDTRRADGFLHEAVEQFLHGLKDILGADGLEPTVVLVRRRWNQVRGSDCALGRGVHLTNFHASLCIDALGYMAEHGSARERALAAQLKTQLRGIIPR